MHLAAYLETGAWHQIDIAWGVDPFEKREPLSTASTGGLYVPRVLAAPLVASVLQLAVQVSGL